MRVSILYILALAFFSPIADLSNSVGSEKSSRKRPNIILLETAPGNNPEANVTLSSNTGTDPLAKRKRTANASASSTEDLSHLASSNRSGASLNSSSAISTSRGTKPVDKMELLTVLLNSKLNVTFNNKIDSIGVLKMPTDVAHELMIACMQNKKEVNLKHMLKRGYRFSFIDGEPAKDDILAFIQAIKDEKTDFIRFFLDSDPVGAIKLMDAAYKASPLSKVVDTLVDVLKKSGSVIDPGAIQLAAETAADLKSITLFKVIYDSDLMVSMIPRSKLLNLFSCPPEDDDADHFKMLLVDINGERRLTSPFEFNLLSQAAIDGRLDFLKAIENCLSIFSWDVVIQAMNFALKKKNYNFVDILLRFNAYSNPDFLFRLVSEIEFTKSVGEFANNEIIDKLTNAVYRDGMNLLIVDLNLMRICMRAAEFGNIEVIDYLLRNGYFDFDTHFNCKSIFRIALENGRTDLVKYLIRVFRYSIFDSDTLTINPAQFGGDSLIYTARNSHAELFDYLLRLGANPNAKVNNNGTLLNLVYWCMMTGQDKIVKLLLDFNCELDPSIAISYNNFPPTVATIYNHLKEAQARLVR